LIWSTASLIELATVTSEIAIVPDSEFSEPIFTVGPEVSTQEAAAASLDASSLAPQAVSNRPVRASAVGTTSALVTRRERCRRAERGSDMWRNPSDTRIQRLYSCRER